MKHYKLVEFLSNLNVKLHPCMNVKSPTDDFLAMVLFQTHLCGVHNDNDICAPIQQKL